MTTLIHKAKPIRGPLQVAERASATLLVVDDSVFQHHVITGLLKAEDDLRIIFAKCGEEALAVLEREAPNLILTDLIMPDSDGLELVQQVRDRFPALPMILMTAYGSEEVAMRALRAGATNYVPKRDLARDLAATVRQILRLSAVNRQRQQLMRCLARRESAFELDNDPDVACSLMQLIQEEIDGLGFLDRVAQIRVGVALQEALTNAIYHGNLEVSSDLRQDDEKIFYDLARARREQVPYASRCVRVLIHIDRQAATFVIRDEGPGFDTSRLDRPVETEDLMRIGGRGLLLIRTFMDEVTFNKAGNQITLVKRYASEENPEGT